MAILKDQDQVPASEYRFDPKNQDLSGSGFDLKGPDYKTT
jgi:hypothetical protein